MNIERLKWSVLAGVLFAILSWSVRAQNVAFVDSQGNQWRQLTDTIGFTYAQIESVCPPLGGACTGSLPAPNSTGSPNCKLNPNATDCVNFIGWNWATLKQVLTLFQDPAFNIPAMPGPGFNRDTFDESANLCCLWNFVALAQVTPGPPLSYGPFLPTFYLQPVNLVGLGLFSPGPWVVNGYITTATPTRPIPTRPCACERPSCKNCKRPPEPIKWGVAWFIASGSQGQFNDAGWCIEASSCNPTNGPWYSVYVTPPMPAGVWLWQPSTTN